jgi:hypothetical protein
MAACRNRELNATSSSMPPAAHVPCLTATSSGGALGGPIVKEKTFFFVSNQHTRERNSASLTNSVTFPNIPADLTYDRSLAALNPLNAAMYSPGATVPALSPISVRPLQAKLPDGSWAFPSAAGTAASPAIPVVTPLSPVSIPRGYVPHQSRSVDRTEQSPLRQSLLLRHVVLSVAVQLCRQQPFQIPGYGGNIEFLNRVVSLNDSHILRPTLVNQAHFGYRRIKGPSSP